MNERTKIEWCDATWNPWIGCTKGAQRSRTSAGTWKHPLRWESECAIHPGYPHKIFPSLCDWLDDEAPLEWLADFLKLIHDTPHLTWLLLTKRPENFYRARKALESRWGDQDQTWVSAWCDSDEQVRCADNVWPGVSVENQNMADLRIRELVNVPAKVRFLSVEPMLDQIDLQYAAFNGADSLRKMQGVHWVIFGGESGPNARPCNVEWIRDGVRQCRAAGVAPFVKQLGSNVFADPQKDSTKFSWDAESHRGKRLPESFID